MTEEPSVFSRMEMVGIREEWAHSRTARCPRCDRTLLAERIEPNPQVAYVRRRHWLLCPSCGRSALLETPRDG